MTDLERTHRARALRNLRECWRALGPLPLREPTVEQEELILAANRFLRADEDFVRAANAHLHAARDNA